MTTTILKQLQMILAIWTLHKPITEEGLEHKQYVINLIEGHIKDIKYALQNEDYFAFDEIMEGIYDRAC